jgi:hypothetical protein
MGYPSEAVRRYGDQYMPELVDPLATRYKAMQLHRAMRRGFARAWVGRRRSRGAQWMICERMMHLNDNE